MRKPRSLFYKISSLFLICGLLFFYYFINKIKDDYHKLILQETRILHITQILTKESNSKNLLLLKALINEKDGISDSTKRNFSQITFKNDSLLADIKSHIYTKKELAGFDKIIGSRQVYNNNFKALLQLSQDKTESELLAYYDEKLEPEFQQYQDDIALFAASIKNTSLDSSNEIGNDISYVSKMILFLSSSPVVFFLLVSVFLILIVGFFFWIDKRLDLTK